MITYGIIISISFLASLFSEYFNKKSRFLCVAFIFIAVFLPSVIAGMRSYDVGGPDLMLYGINCWNHAVYSTSLWDGVNFYDGGRIEIGYMLFNYFVSRFTNNLHFFLFILSFVTSGSFFLALRKLRNDVHLPLDWLGYLCFYYVQSFNLLRQSLAMSLVFLGISFAIKSGWKRAIIIIFIAIFIHSSAIIGILLFVYIEYVRKRSVKRIIFITIFFVGLIYVSFIFLEKFVDLGLMSDKYVAYSNLGTDENNNLLSFSNLYRLVPYIILMHIFSKNKKDINGLYLILITSIELFLVPLRLMSSVAIRIAYYFGYFRMSSYSWAMKNSKSVVRKRMIYIFLIFYYILFFIYSCIFNTTFNYNYFDTDFFNSLVGIFRL